MEKHNKTYIWTRIIGIPAIGIMMPLFFYDGDDTARLLMWMIISMVITFLFWEVGQRVSKHINIKYPINTFPGKHLVIMLLFFSVLSVFTIIFIFFINILFGNVSPDYWYEMKGIHIIIILITFFITAIHEGIFLFFKWKNSLIVIEKYKKLSQNPSVYNLDFTTLVNALKKKSKSYKKRFTINVGSKIRIINTDDIAYFYSTNKAVFLRTISNKDFDVDYSLTKLENILNPEFFFRINRKYIIRIQSIDELITLSKSRLLVKLHPHVDEKIIITYQRSGTLKKWLNR